MTPEPDFKATPEQIARITRTAIKALAETHVIVPKEEFVGLLRDHALESENTMWHLILSTYHETSVKLAEVVSPERHKGVELGGKLLERLRAVALEELAKAHGEDPAETLQDNV